MVAAATAVNGMEKAHNVYTIYSEHSCEQNILEESRHSVIRWNCYSSTLYSIQPTSSYIALASKLPADTVYSLLVEDD